MNLYKTLLFIALSFATCLMTFAGDIRAVTEEGRKVVLHTDGSWEYDTLSHGAARTEALKSSVTGYIVNYNPVLWTVKKNTETNPSAEFELEHVTKEAYALLISDKSNLPPIALKKSFMEKMRSTASSLQVLEDTTGTVNGVGVSIVTVKATIQDMSFVYHTLFYSSDKGSFQLSAFTLERFIDDYRKDFEDLFRGFVAM